MRTFPKPLYAFPKPRASVRSAVGHALAESRLVSVGLITSGLAHGLAAVLLSSLWGSASMHVVPPRHGRNSVDLVAAQAVFDQSAASQPPQAIAVETSDAAPRGGDPMQFRPRRLPTSRQAAVSADLGSEPNTLQGGEPTLPPTSSVGRRAPAATERRQRSVVGIEPWVLEPPETVPRPRRATMASHPSVPTVRQQGQEAPTPPQQFYSPLPEWPAEARRAQLGGRVVVRAKVGTDGRVMTASVFRSSGVPSLDEAAVRAVRKWRFEPARRFGLAMEMEIGVPIHFRIE